MKIISVFTTLLLLLIVVEVKAQSDETTKSMLQQRFFSKHFIRNRTSPLEIRSAETIDSLFTKFRNSWEAAAPDTLKKYKLKMSLTTFKYIDAYAYLISIINISGGIKVSSLYGEHLLKNYLIPAVAMDISTVKQHPGTTSINLIWDGSLTNTISMGSSNSMSKEINRSTYDLYNSFEKLSKPLLKSRDTTVRNYVDLLLKNIKSFKLVLQSQTAYYDKNYNRSLDFLLTGLESNSFPSTKVLGMSERLLDAFKSSGEKDKSLKLLNALMLHTTKESINREVLKNWYIKIDSLNGKGIFDHIIANLPPSSFKHSEKRFNLPEKWNFIANAVSPEAVKKTKYYLVDVWYTGCGPCLAEIPDLNSFHDKLKNRDDITFISINTDFVNVKDDEKYVLDVAKDREIKYPIVYDNFGTNLVAQLGVESFPAKYIIDSTGRIITKLDNSKNSLKSFDMFIQELK